MWNSRNIPKKKMPLLVTRTFLKQDKTYAGSGKAS